MTAKSSNHFYTIEVSQAELTKTKGSIFTKEHKRLNVSAHLIFVTTITTAGCVKVLSQV